VVEKNSELFASGGHMHKKLLVLLIAMTQVMVMAKGPIMKFASKEVDLGKVDPGKKVQAIFKFTNTGDEKLIIKSVKPG
jgi:hypothetical protein